MSSPMTKPPAPTSRASPRPRRTTSPRACWPALGRSTSPRSICGFTVHGTTQGLNAFLQRRGERVLLLATAGRRRQSITSPAATATRLYDIHYRKPTPLVPRRDIVEIGGRLDCARRGARAARRGGRARRRRARARRGLRRGRRRLPVPLLESRARAAGPRDPARGAGRRTSRSRSRTEVAREWREYERTSSAVVDAYTAPDRAPVSASARGASCAAAACRCRCTSCSPAAASSPPQSARERRCRRCSPARSAARSAVSRWRRMLGRPNLICVDMGGTSFDVSPRRRRRAGRRRREATLEGFPLLMRVVNIHTIGAGGGSIAYVEAGGLRVGPAERRAPIRGPPATAAAAPSRPSPTPTSCSAASTRPGSPAAR